MEAIELYDSMDSNQCLFVDDNYLFLNNCKNYYSRSNSWLPWFHNIPCYLIRILKWEILFGVSYKYTATHSRNITVILEPATQEQRVKILFERVKAEEDVVQHRGLWEEDLAVAGLESLQFLQEINRSVNFFAQDDNTSGLSTEEMAEVLKNDVELLMKSRWTRCSHAMIMPRWCRRWVLRTTGPSTAGAAVLAATSTLSAGLSLQLMSKIKMENCLSPAASRCGGPLEERPCPVEGCEETIGGANEQLNASNRLEGNLILFAWWWNGTNANGRPVLWLLIHPT